MSSLVMVVITHPIGRIAGPLWIGGGLLIYVVYRRRQHLPFPESIGRDWPTAQLEIYRESGEESLAEEYEHSLHRARRDAETASSRR